MSVGFGLGDAALVTKKFCEIITLLHGEAVDEFRRFERAYRDLQGLSGLINHFADDPEHENTFPRESKEINRLLRKFHCKIRELEPFLGRYRERNNVRGCLQKIRWPVHSRKLEQIRKDLMSQLKLISMKRQFCQKNPFMEHYFFRNSFDLEDACGKFHKFDFFSVVSWEALHEFLLRIFPQGHRGHEIIQSHRYLLHKSEPFAEILCNSPGIKPIQDVIKPRELVRMSAIFPKLEIHDRECPKCHRRRDADFQGQALTCVNSRCGLWLRFHDSYDNQPDPLTQIALDNIKSSGRADFAARFLQPRSQLGNPSAGIGGSIYDRIAQIGPPPPVPSRSKRPKIRYFRSVTLCNPQWPELFQDTASEKAMDLLRETTQGLERTRQALDSEDLPFAKAAALINTRFLVRSEKRGL